MTDPPRAQTSCQSVTCGHDARCDTTVRRRALLYVVLVRRPTTAPVCSYPCLKPHMLVAGYNEQMYVLALLLFCRVPDCRSTASHPSFVPCFSITLSFPAPGTNTKQRSHPSRPGKLPEEREKGRRREVMKVRRGQSIRSRVPRPSAAR